VGSKTFGGLNRRLKEKTAESRWFATTGQAPFGRAKAAYWKITKNEFSYAIEINSTLIGSRALAAYDDVDGSSTANNRPWSRQCTARLFEGLTPVHVPILSE
jgi:hypothetical protein